MRRILLLTSTVLLSAQTASAAGFQVREQSAEGLGRAYSGEAVAASNASGLWFNPAQAVRLGAPGEKMISAGGSILYVPSDLENTGTTITRPGAPALPVLGDNGSDPIDVTFVPQGAALWRINEEFAVGASFNSPFGLVVDYGEEYFGRYDSTESELLTLDASATAAWAPAPGTALGASVHLQYVEADLTTALPDPLGRPGDGSSVLEGNNYALGWSVGAVQEVGNLVTVGVSYRSEVKHEVDGSVIVEGLQAPLDTANGRREATTEITLPDSARIGVAFQASPTVQLTAQAEWVGWSDFESLDVLFPDNGQVQSTVFDYRNRTNYGVGIDWATSDRLTLRAGVSADPTPTRDEERSTRVPDTDRTWFTAGGTYAFSERGSVDLGLAYIDASTTQVRSTSVAYGGTPLATTIETDGNLSGEGFVGAVGVNFGF